MKKILKRTISVFAVFALLLNTVAFAAVVSDSDDPTKSVATQFIFEDFNAATDALGTVSASTANGNTLKNTMFVSAANTLQYGAFGTDANKFYAYKSNADDTTAYAAVQQTGMVNAVTGGRKDSWLSLGSATNAWENFAGTFVVSYDYMTNTSSKDTKMGYVAYADKSQDRGIISLPGFAYDSTSQKTYLYAPSYDDGISYDYTNNKTDKSFEPGTWVNVAISVTKVKCGEGATGCTDGHSDLIVRIFINGELLEVGGKTSKRIYNGTGTNEKYFPCDQIPDGDESGVTARLTTKNGTAYVGIDNFQVKKYTSTTVDVDTAALSDDSKVVFKLTDAAITSEKAGEYNKRAVVDVSDLKATVKNKTRNRTAEGTVKVGAGAVLKGYWGDTGQVVGNEETYTEKQLPGNFAELTVDVGNCYAMPGDELEVTVTDSNGAKVLDAAGNEVTISTTVRAAKAVTTGAISDSFLAGTEKTAVAKKFIYDGFDYATEALGEAKTKSTAKGEMLANSIAAGVSTDGASYGAFGSADDKYYAYKYTSGNGLAFFPQVGAYTGSSRASNMDNWLAIADNQTTGALTAWGNFDGTFVVSYDYLVTAETNGQDSQVRYAHSGNDYSIALLPMFVYDAAAQKASVKLPGPGNRDSDGLTPHRNLTLEEKFEVGDWVNVAVAMTKTKCTHIGEAKHGDIMVRYYINGKPVTSNGSDCYSITEGAGKLCSNLNDTAKTRGIAVRITNKSETIWSGIDNYAVAAYDGTVISGSAVLKNGAIELDVKNSGIVNDNALKGCAAYLDENVTAGLINATYTVSKIAANGNGGAETAKTVAVFAPGERTAVVAGDSGTTTQTQKITFERGKIRLSGFEALGAGERYMVTITGTDATGADISKKIFVYANDADAAKLTFRKMTDGTIYYSNPGSAVVGKLIKATFGSDGLLSNCVTEDITLTAGAKNSVAGTVAAGTTLFFWDGFANMKPIIMQ